jgi:hypothetical protein
MKLSSCVRAAALAAAVVSFAAPAMGQITDLSQLSEKQRAEVYCLSDELQRDEDTFYLVANAYFNDEDVEEAETALLGALDACAARYKWDEKKKGIGGDAGFSIAVLTFLIGTHLAEGGKMQDVEAIDRVMVKLSRDDLDHLHDGTWEDDEPFIRRLNALLIAEKFPEDDYDLETARLIMEAHVMQSSAAWEWVNTYIKKN